MDSLKKVALGFRDRITKTPLERQISEICSDENYGTSNTLLHEVAEKTYNPEERTVIMRSTWEYVKSPQKEWRRIYKALNLVEHLLKFGSTSCVNEIRDEGFKIRMLQDFSYRENSEERGIGIRDKCKYIGALIADHRLLDEEREKAKKLWNKFSGGISSNDAGRGYQSEQRYDNEYRGGAYDPYPKRHEPEYQQQPETVYQEPSPVPTRNEQPKIDIFSAPTVKPVNTKSQPGRINPPPNEGNIFEKISVKKPQAFQEPVWNQPIQKPVDIWGQPAVQKAPDVFPAHTYTQPPPQQTYQNPLESIWTQPPQESWTQPRQAPQETWTQPRQAPQESWTQPPVYVNPPVAQPIYSKPPEPKLQNPLESLWTTSHVQAPSYESAPGSVRVQPTYHPQPAYPPQASYLPQPPIKNPAWQPPAQTPPPSSWQTASIPDVWSHSSEIPQQGGQGQSGANHVKMNINIQDSQGPTMSQLKAHPRQQMEFSGFQTAPEQPARAIDLEAKLMNLDNLELGQPSFSDPKYNYRPSRY